MVRYSNLFRAPFSGDEFLLRLFCSLCFVVSHLGHCILFDRPQVEHLHGFRLLHVPVDFAIWWGTPAVLVLAWTCLAPFRRFDASWKDVLVPLVAVIGTQGFATSFVKLIFDMTTVLLWWLSLTVRMSDEKPRTLIPKAVFLSGGVLLVVGVAWALRFLTGYSSSVPTGLDPVLFERESMFRFLISTVLVSVGLLTFVIRRSFRSTGIVDGVP